MKVLNAVMHVHTCVPLLQVARAWHTDVAKFLLEHGAQIDHADNFGRTALHVAAAVDYPEMVRFLIEHKGVYHDTEQLYFVKWDIFFLHDVD